jgi:hypothetical protein
MLADENVSGNTSKRIEAMRRLLSEVMPVCGVCKSAAEGHLFKSMASTPIREGQPDRPQALLHAIKQHDWTTMLSFNEWEGTLASVDAIGLKCPSGRCSVVALLSPYELSEPYVLLHQEVVSDCGGPLEGGYWGQI